MSSSAPAQAAAPRETASADGGSPSRRRRRWEEENESMAVAYRRRGTVELPPTFQTATATTPHSPPLREWESETSSPSSPLPLVDFISRVRRSLASSRGSVKEEEGEEQQRQTSTSPIMERWRRRRRRKKKKKDWRSEQEEEEAPSSPLLPPNRFSIQEATPSVSSRDHDSSTPDFSRTLRVQEEAEEAECSISIISRKSEWQHPTTPRSIHSADDRRSLGSGRFNSRLGMVKSRILSRLSSSLIRMPGTRRRSGGEGNGGDGSGSGGDGGDGGDGGGVLSGRSSSTPPLVVTMTDGIARIQTREEAAKKRKKRCWQGWLT